MVEIITAKNLQFGNFIFQVGSRFATILLYIFLLCFVLASLSLSILHGTSSFGINSYSNNKQPIISGIVADCPHRVCQKSSVNHIKHTYYMRLYRVHWLLFLMFTCLNVIAVLIITQFYVEIER